MVKLTSWLANNWCHNFFQRDGLRLFQLYDQVDQVFGSLHLIKEMVPTVFQFHKEMQHILGCESQAVCDVTQLWEADSQFVNDTNTAEFPSVFKAVEGQHMSALQFVNTTLNHSLHSLIEQSNFCDIQTVNLSNILSVYLRYLQALWPPPEFQDCRLLTEEALNVTNMLCDMLLFLTKKGAQSFNFTSEMPNLLFFSQQTGRERQSVNWGDDWEQNCGWTLKFIPDVKYDLLLGRENLKSCEDIFDRVLFSSGVINNLLKFASNFSLSMREALQKAESFLQHNATKQSITESFSNSNFKRAKKTLELWTAKLDIHSLDMSEQSLSDIYCVPKALDRFLREFLLPLTWDVISELEIVQEVKKQHNSAFRTKDFDVNIGSLVDFMISNFSLPVAILSDGLWNLSYAIEYLVENVDQVTSLLEVYTRQTTMGAAYFKWVILYCSHHITKTKIQLFVLRNISENMYPETHSLILVALIWSFSSRKNFLKMDIYFPTLSKEVIQQNPAFELLSLLSEIGGFLGLLLGASVLTVCEFVDYLLLKCCEKFNSQKTGERRNNQVWATTRRTGIQNTAGTAQTLDLGVLELGLWATHQTQNTLGFVIKCLHIGNI